MRRLLLILTACLMATSCASPADRGGSGAHAARPQHRTSGGTAAAGTATVHKYAYGRGPNQRLVAYRDPHPRGHMGRRRTAPGRRPVVVILHGGFWFLPQPPPPNPWAEHIASHGAVVFDVDYRRNLDAPWPAQRSDVLHSLSWITHRAARFGIDPHRIVLLGSSAGGQIATNIGAYGAGRRRVIGVAALSPVADPYLAWRTATVHATGNRWDLALRNNTALLAGCPPSRGAQPQRVDCRAVWRDMNAAQHASGRDDAPMLLIHSRHDFVTVANSLRLRRAEMHKGMPARDITVHIEPGGAHGGALMGIPGVAPTVLKWIERRLDD